MEFLQPDWPAPAGVRAISTLRSGGISLPPYDSFNLGDHVGDAPEAVAGNRRILQTEAGLKYSPAWLRQTHSTRVVDAAQVRDEVEADASFVRQPGSACVVMTADCLPVLLCDRQARVVAAVHAGWRGLVDGIIEATVKTMNLAGQELMAWLGPAIGPQAFEVGDEVRQMFLAHDSKAERAFQPNSNGRWLADLYRLAQQRLTACGVLDVYGGTYCTYSDPARFYSYRREGVTGRMASLIWLVDDGDEKL